MVWADGLAYHARGMDNRQSDGVLDTMASVPHDRFLDRVAGSPARTPDAPGTSPATRQRAWSTSCATPFLVPAGAVIAPIPGLDALTPVLEGAALDCSRRSNDAPGAIPAGDDLEDAGRASTPRAI
jgi:hypothetical protein